MRWDCLIEKEGDESALLIIHDKQWGGYALNVLPKQTRTHTHSHTHTLSDMLACTRHPFQT